MLEVGEGLTSAVCVYEGFALPHTALHLPLGGQVGLCLSIALIAFCLSLCLCLSVSVASRFGLVFFIGMLRAGLFSRAILLWPCSSERT